MPDPATSGELDPQPTRLLWFEVDELSGPALRVRRVVYPSGSIFFQLWFVGWIGISLCGMRLLSPYLPGFFVLVGLWLLWNSFDALGIGSLEWEAANDLLVVRRRWYSWSRAQRFTRLKLEIYEEPDSESHLLTLFASRGEEGVELIRMNHPTADERREMDELVRRLARVTGWKLTNSVR